MEVKSPTLANQFYCNMNNPFFPYCGTQTKIFVFFPHNLKKILVFLNASARDVVVVVKYQTPVAASSKATTQFAATKAHVQATWRYYAISVYRSHRLCSSTKSSSYRRFNKRGRDLFPVYSHYRVQNAIRFYVIVLGNLKLDLRGGGGGGGGALAGVTKPRKERRDHHQTRVPTDDDDDAQKILRARRRRRRRAEERVSERAGQRERETRSISPQKTTKGKKRAALFFLFSGSFFFAQKKKRLYHRIRLLCHRLTPPLLLFIIIIIIIVLLLLKQQQQQQQKQQHNTRRSVVLAPTGL